MKALVTGGAGLVGSSMCEKLLKNGAEVFCVDNLSLGTEKHIAPFGSNKNFTFEKWDVSQPLWHKPIAGQKFDVLIHLAANSDISASNADPRIDYSKTFQTTFEALIASKELKIPNFIFSSTSAVYGANPPFPTPENTSNMHPVSIYGAGKLASEAFISSFVENYGLNAWVFRFGNVVGERLTHGVIYDFTSRLRKDPSTLKVLGNGTQHKTYIDVEDTVDGILHAYQKSHAGKTHADKFQIFNLSTDGAVTVKEIAEETVKVVAASKAKIVYGESSIGWVGDVPKTSLDIKRMQKLGWKPKLSSHEAVFQSISKYYRWS